MAKNIVLLGKQDVKDYAAVKTLYTFNALTEAGASVKIYDVDQAGDLPARIDASIYLPWVENIGAGWAKFIPTLPGRKILYTDNWHWYDQTCGRLNGENIDLDDLFNIVAFASSENILWWPKQKFEWWGALVDEDIVQPRAAQDYIWVDELWPKQWCDGEFTANDVFDIAIPVIKEKYGVSVMSQKPKEPGSNDKDTWTPVTPAWIDESIDQRIDHQQLQVALSGAKAYLTSHHECLGLMQFEAMVAGVPVVTNPRLSKSETFASGPDTYRTWEWEKDPNDEYKFIANPEAAAEQLITAVGEAIELNRSAIRESAIARYGKKAWVLRTDLI